MSDNHFSVDKSRVTVSVWTKRKLLSHQKNVQCCIDTYMREESELMLLGAVAERLGLRPHQIVYAISSHSVPDVILRIGNRRMFRPSDVRRLADHFGIALPRKANNE